MAWAPGPQQVSSITVGAGNAIGGDKIANYSSETEGSSYDSAKGIPVDRGFVTKTISFECLDYSEVAAIETLMTARTLSDVNVTFIDAVDKDITAEAVAQIVPIVNTVPDTCQFYFEAKDASQDWASISAWTDAGVIVGEPSFEFDFPFDGVDGCGRPYYGGLCRANITFQLAGIRGASTDVYAALGTFGANVDVAFKMPNGKYMAFKDMYMYFYYGPENASGVRTINVELRGVATAWSSMLFYTDGGVTPATTAWGVTASDQSPGDLYAGGLVTLTGTDYTETGLVSW